MIVGRPRAHALEFLDPDEDLFNAEIVGEVWNGGASHAYLPGSAREALRSSGRTIALRVPEW
jgi:hypothetical protein